MKKLIVVAALTIISFSANRAMANNFWDTVGGVALGVVAGNLVNNAINSSQQAPMYYQQQQMFTYIGPNGGAAEFNNGFCLENPSDFPNGAIFRGWVQDWQGRSFLITKHVPPGRYPAGCW